MNEVVRKLLSLGPEVAMAIGACLCLAFGLAPQRRVRAYAAPTAALALMAAGVLVLRTITGHTFLLRPESLALLTMTSFIKLAAVGVGLLLLLVNAQLPDQLAQINAADNAPPGSSFEPATMFRGEFFAFFLLSLIGVMLCAGADDLVWLLLALELTSLPTYVMVAISRDRPQAQEAAVKYFFLGALAVALFLYGFALIYGATGSTRLADIHQFIALQNARHAGLPSLFLVGLVLALVGISFKIAAVPMHFYAADVYQGAATPVTAFLAFVPKTAGFVSLILLLNTVQTNNGDLPQVIIWLLWGMAGLTMTVGNVLGLMQTSVKRVLAYSSIAHSGYMLVGLVAGGDPNNAFTLGNGIAAVLFYLVAYGLANLGAFAVLGCLQTRGDEADSFDDISGLSQRHPRLAAVLLLSVLSLIGLPPLVGFLGKIYLFGSAIQHGYIVLVVIAVLNSAISAVYYLRIAAACYFGPPADDTTILAAPSRQMGGTLAAAAAVALGVAGGFLIDSARHAAEHRLPAPAVQQELTTPLANLSATSLHPKEATDAPTRLWQ